MGRWVADVIILTCKLTITIWVKFSASSFNTTVSTTMQHKYNYRAHEKYQTQYIQFSLNVYRPFYTVTMSLA